MFNDTISGNRMVLLTDGQNKSGKLQLTIPFFHKIGITRNISPPRCPKTQENLQRSSPPNSCLSALDPSSPSQMDRN